jgi:hypothetical protein
MQDMAGVRQRDGASRHDTLPNTGHVPKAEADLRPMLALFVVCFLGTHCYINLSRATR